MKRLVFSMMTICLMSLIILFTGCEEPQKEIDKKFQGKWETQSVSLQGTTYTPGSFIVDGTQYNSGGFLIDATSIKVYVNGISTQTFSNIYSDTYADGTGYFCEQKTDAKLGIDMEVSGNTAKLSPSYNTTYNLKKVSKFSWQ